MHQWKKNIVSWRMGRALYLSIPFTWMLPEAREQATKHKGPVFAGGPAVDLMPGYMSSVAILDEPPPISPLAMHNPMATFTSRGCVNQCGFCAVPKIEGGLKELSDWPIRPVICDNNLLACSRKHFDRVIDRLKTLPAVDFNQGLDARLFKPHHARRIAELQNPKVRFAFDWMGMENHVADSVSLARKHGLKNLGCYVLIGFRDTPEDALYRLKKVQEWKIDPNPMRYQPLDSLKKNDCVMEPWTHKKLQDMVRYFSNMRFFRAVPFDEYHDGKQMSLPGF